MSLKAMVFIDGSWFYNSRQILFDIKDEIGFEIDYAHIPALISDWLSKCVNDKVDVVRTFYFGALPINKPGYNQIKQRAFYSFLANKCGIDVEVLDIDFKHDQDFGKDRSVSVALAAAMMHFAVIPGAYDIAVLVSGNSGYRPLLKRVRNWGRRTALVAINNAENRNVTNTSLLADQEIFDFSTLFLDDHINDIKLIRKEQKRECKVCGREEVSTWAGVEFYCSQCRTDHRKRIRTCDACGKEEETSWEKDYFYCTQCRKMYNEKNNMIRIGDDIGEM